MKKRTHAGEKLRSARTGHGWSRMEMVIQMHEKCSRTVSDRSIGRYERGEVLPKYDMARALCKCLGVEFDTVFSDGLGVA